MLKAFYVSNKNTKQPQLILNTIYQPKRIPPNFPFYVIYITMKLLLLLSAIIYYYRYYYF